MVMKTRFILFSKQNILNYTSNCQWGKKSLKYYTESMSQRAAISNIVHGLEYPSIDSRPVDLNNFATMFARLYHKKSMPSATHRTVKTNVQFIFLHIFPRYSWPRSRNVCNNFCVCSSWFKRMTRMMMMSTMKVKLSRWWAVTFE